MAGDLTDPPDSASVRFWTGRQSLFGASVCYRDAWEAAHGDKDATTYTHDNPILADPDWPFRRLDYILVRCGIHWGPTFAVKRCERVFGQPVDGVRASDHFGILADLEPPERPAPPPPNLSEELEDPLWRPIVGLGERAPSYQLPSVCNRRWMKRRRPRRND